MAPKFHNRSGTLTAYALACGHVDVRTFTGRTHTVTGRTRAELWSESGVYGATVRSKDADGNTVASCTRRFRTLAAARKAWRSVKTLA